MCGLRIVEVERMRRVAGGVRFERIVEICGKPSGGGEGNKLGDGMETSLRKPSHELLP